MGLYPASLSGPREPSCKTPKEQTSDEDVRPFNASSELAPSPRRSMRSVRCHSRCHAGPFPGRFRPVLSVHTLTLRVPKFAGSDGNPSWMAPKAVVAPTGFGSPASSLDVSFQGLALAG